MSSDFYYLLTIGGEDHGQLRTVFSHRNNLPASNLWRGYGGAKRPVEIYTALDTHAAALALLSLDLESMAIYQEESP